MKKWLGIIGTGVLLIAFVACGKNQESQTNTSDKSESSYPLTVSNYTKSEGSSDWRKKDQTFESTPKKVLANTRPAAELLLHLGIKDSIAGVGATFGAVDPDVSREFDTLKDLGTEYISKEIALSVSPDLMYGRGGLFENQDWGIGTVDSINEIGIPTYVQETSVTNATFDSVYKDIKNLGELFNVEDKASEFSDEIKERENKLKNAVLNNDRQTFAYLHMSDPSIVSIYAAQNESFFNSMFEMIKMDNVFKDFSGSEVSVETLIETNPDVLIVGDWSSIEDGISGDEIIEELYKNPKLKSMKAIKNKKIYGVDYNYLFGYGYQSLTGLERLVEEMK